MSGSVSSKDSESSPVSSAAPSPRAVFSAVASGKRSQVLAAVLEPGVSLGMLDPTTGRCTPHINGGNEILHKFLQLILGPILYIIMYTRSFREKQFRS